MGHWYIDCDGEVVVGGGITSSCEDSLNEFTNKEFAEKIVFKQLMERKLLKFKEEYDNVKLDWRKADQRKWYISYIPSVKDLNISYDFRGMSQGAINFSSYEIADKCIGMYKDDLIKYFELGIW